MDILSANYVKHFKREACGVGQRSGILVAMFFGFCLFVFHQGEKAAVQISIQRGVTGRTVDCSASTPMYLLEKMRQGI